MLPRDLRSAEAEALAALRAALRSRPKGRWTVELRFEGLRLMPIGLRLASALAAGPPSPRLLFPDAGAAALARRDAPSQAESIATFSDQLRRRGEADSRALLLLVGASQAEFKEVEELCGAHDGAVVLLNPSLEDAAVGIGSVARQRRRGFLSIWEAAYALQPMADSGLRRLWPNPWELYRLDPDGYRPLTTFPARPTAEERQEALLGEAAAGLGATLTSVDRFIEGLRS